MGAMKPHVTFASLDFGGLHPNYCDMPDLSVIKDIMRSLQHKLTSRLRVLLHTVLKKGALKVLKNATHAASCCPAAWCSRQYATTEPRAGERINEGLKPDGNGLEI